ncbi:MAG: hypothetical protein HOE80_01710 [Candidatus Magasanikbacteria bacterium]|jgi:hypothetical protein|nr:hypothetical protein [Candidatus Magasanikbacteria bacterium]
MSISRESNFRFTPPTQPLEKPPKLEVLSDDLLNSNEGNVEPEKPILFEIPGDAGEEISEETTEEIKALLQTKEKRGIEAARAQVETAGKEETTDARDAFSIPNNEERLHKEDVDLMHKQEPALKKVGRFFRGLFSRKK